MALLINGELIDDTAIREETRLLRERLQAELPDEAELDLAVKAREFALENLIERALLRQAAAGFTEGAAPPDEPSDPDWRTAAFVDHLASRVPRPTRREVSDFYKKHQLLFLTPECVHVSRLVLPMAEREGEAEVRAVLASLEAEAGTHCPLAEIAARFGLPSASVEDLGWITHGQESADLEAVAFALKPNQTSSICHRAEVAYLLHVHARRSAGLLLLREVYPLAEELLLTRRRDEAVERFLAEVRAKSDIRKTSGAASG